MVQNYENLGSLFILYEYCRCLTGWYRSCGPFDLKVPLKTLFTMDLLDITSLSSRSLTAWTCNFWHAYLCTIKTTAFSTWVHRVLGDISYWYASSGCPLTILLPFPRFLRLWKAMHLWCPFWKPSLVRYFQLELSHLYDTYFHFDLRAIVCLWRFSNKWVLPFVSFYDVLNFFFKETNFFPSVNKRNKHEHVGLKDH